MDGGQNRAIGGELVIVFEDTETESPMGKSPHSRSETFTLCPLTFCVCVCLSMHTWTPLCLSSVQVQYVCTLTSIRRVGCGAVEESGRASQVGHACVVSVAVHGAGD